MKNVLISLLLLFFTSCGSEDRHDYRSNGNQAPNEELDDLKKQVLELQGTVAQITSFTANDFTSCNGSLPTFWQTICQISQTSNAEQSATFVGQMQQVAKIFQNELYGTDCINTTDPGCPVLTSVTGRLSTAETTIASHTASITTINANVSTLQTAVAQLQTDVSAIKNRLNNFNGSGNSVETVITGIQSSITTLSARVTVLETTVNSGSIYKTFLICGNISASGPAFEPILLTGDNTKAVAYLVSGTSNGMGVVSQAGVTGSLYLSTFANTATCKFRIYDRTTTIKVCWKNDNRSATSAQIDTACNSPTFASPTAQCTCIN